MGQEAERGVTHHPAPQQLDMFAYRVTTPRPDCRLVAQFSGTDDDMAAAQTWCRRQNRRGGVALWLWSPVVSGAALLAEWPARPVVEHRRETELQRVNGAVRGEPVCRAMRQDDNGRVGPPVPRLRRVRRDDTCPTTQQQHNWQSDGDAYRCVACGCSGYRKWNRIVTARCGQRRRVGGGERRCGAVAVAARVRGGGSAGRVWVCEAHRAPGGE